MPSQRYNQFNVAAAEIHKNAVNKGFWDEDHQNFGEKIALIHTEVSEALEEHRDGREDLYFRPVIGSQRPKPEGTAVELVDAMIRILDVLASMNVDIAEILENKMVYNASRPHMHGKKY